MGQSFPLAPTPAGTHMLSGLSYRSSGRLRVVLLSMLVSGAASGFKAQQPSPSSTEPVDPGAVTLQQPATLHVNVRRVVVDIVVTDAKGHPVKDLPREDFHLFENGKPQALRSFEPHVSESQPPLPKPDLPPNTFSNLSTAPQSGPVTVLLYDLLNTPIDSQPYAHEQLMQFLKQRKVSGQMAIFVLSDKLHMLQGFTDDEDQLIAAMNLRGKKLYKSGSLQAPGEASQQSDQFARTQGSDTGSVQDQNVSVAAVSAMLQHMEQIETSALIDQRVRITADALQEISRFLIGLPGRKNLIWMSASFPSGILPDGAIGGRDSVDVTRNYSETLVKATDLLNLSHVAVYPVDVRGLQTNPLYSGSTNQTFVPGGGKDIKAVTDFSTQNDAEHATMDNIGDETGGRAFYNTNGLKEAVSTALDEGSVYYTVTYSPAPMANGAMSALDGNLRKVRVELSGPGVPPSGYKLYYRRSYFADDLDTAVQASQDLPTDPLAVSLEHGAPVSHELFFEAHLQTYGAPTPATPEQLEVLATYEARATGKKPKANKPVLLDKHPTLMQRYIITYGLLLRQLTLTNDANGVHRGNLDFAVMSFNDDGLALNGIRSQINDVIPPERYQHLQNSGYQVVQTFAVPVEALSLRLAVRDTATNRIGSMEIRLPLAQTQTTPSPAPTTAAPATK